MADVSAQPRTGPYLCVVVVSVAFLLLMRSMGLYPTVFADEYTYSRFARLLSFEETTIPGYLYFSIYGVTNLCGDGFLGCARILNVLFFVTATPFIYLIGTRVAGRRTALLIASLSILGPINSYTAYFMPESLYFLSFWLLTYLVLCSRNEHGSRRWLFLGVIFGAGTLIKPHALFLIPPLLVYFWLIRYRFQEGESHAASYGHYLGFLASALATKLIAGFALAGLSGVTLFGAAYTSVALGSMGGLNHYVSLLKLAAENLLGHFLSLSVLFAVPLGSLLVGSASVLRRNSEPRLPMSIALYTSLVLACLLIVVAGFTASVSSSGPYESNVRLHMRYYNFVFPLLLLVAASHLPPQSNGTSVTSRAIVGIPLGAAVCYAVYTGLAPYVPSFIDNPELRGFTFNSTVFHVLAGTSLFCLALWVYSARSGAKCFVYLFMPLAVSLSTYYVNQELRHRLVPDVFDNAGIFTKRYLPAEDIAKVVVVGSEPAGLFRSLFYLDDPEASYASIPKGASYDPRELPTGKEWVLIIGDHSLADDTFHQLSMNGFTLARVSGFNTVDFRKPSWPGVISSARGLSLAERWGAWSASDVVTLQFSMPLPEKFRVHLIAHAFGPNVGEEIVAQVGNSASRFTLSGKTEERILDFNNPGRSRTLSFNVPSAVSPRELGLSADERSLGIGFVQMRIERL